MSHTGATLCGFGLINLSVSRFIPRRDDDDDDDESVAGICGR
jgi:hypothetical protein